MVEACSEWNLPAVQLKTLNVGQQLVSQTRTLILGLHLNALEVLLVFGNKGIHGNHNEHDNNAGPHTVAKQVMQTNETQNDLKGARPKCLAVLGQILQALSINGH